jgi:hypothetical protein
MAAFRRQRGEALTRPFDVVGTRNAKRVEAEFVRGVGQALQQRPGQKSRSA